MGALCRAHAERQRHAHTQREKEERESARQRERERREHAYQLAHCLACAHIPREHAPQHAQRTTCFTAEMPLLGGCVRTQGTFGVIIVRDYYLLNLPVARRRKSIDAGKTVIRFEKPEDTYE